MKLKKIITVFLVIFATSLNYTIYGQCSGGTNGGALNPVPAATTSTMAVTNGRYYTFSVPASPCAPIYMFSFCSADGGSNSQTDTQITILDNSGAYAGGYNDDYCASLSYLTWSPSSTVAATYRVLVNKYNCTTGGTGVLAYKVTNSYTNTAEYTVIGSAVYAAGCATVTPNSGGLTGCTWDVNSTLNFASNWSYDFNVNLGSNDAGADGMAFVIQNDPRGRCACGSNGGSLAAGGISNSLIVEIDTYINYEDRDDFISPTIGCLGIEDPDHLDLWVNGVVNPNLDANCNAVAAGERPVVANAVRLQNPPGTNYNIENGMNHTLRVSWVTGSPGTFTARIMNTALTTTYGVISTTLDPVATFSTTTPYFGFTGSTGGLSNQQSFCSPPALLPVQLLYMTAECTENGISVSWATASELHNKQFNILRSEDGISYSTIGTVNGNGTTNVKILYNYLDATALAGTIYYYKLQQIDFSGTSKTYNLAESADRSCRDAVPDITVSPNPANESITLGLGNLSPKSIEIYGTKGDLCYFLEPQQEASSTLEIVTSQFSDGIYLLKLNTEQNVITKKLIVRHQ